MEYISTRYVRFLTSWARFVNANAVLVVLGALALSIFSGWFVATHLSINTDDTDMLSSELPFRKHAIELKKALRSGGESIAVVIDGATSGIADDAALRLAAIFRNRPEVFGPVFDPAGDPFFRRNGLLYLDESDLEALLDRLAQAQPFLGSLAQDPTLRGFSHVLSLAAEEVAKDRSAVPFDLVPVLNALAEVAEARAAGRKAWFPWRGLVSGDAAPGVSDRRILVIEPPLDYGSLSPAAGAMRAVRQAALDAGLVEENGVRVRLTGSAALASEELASVEEGMGIAGALSMTLVLVLLGIGLRSVRLVAATLSALVAGLVWTAAFAVAAVGELNMISVAFAVLFIGLSVDFGIHFALRYKEEIDRGLARKDALDVAVQGVGGSLTLCAVAAAIGFLSFTPTAYRGLAELGVIAAGGMAIALIANLTLVPAVLALLPLRRGRSEAQFRSRTLGQVIRRNERSVVRAALVVAVVAAAALPFARFDFDPMNLKDPETESVSTLLDLMKDGNTSPYTIQILAKNLSDAKRMTGLLRKSERVRSARSLSDYVPSHQSSKVDLIAQAALFLAPALDSGAGISPPGHAELLDGLTGLRRSLSRLADSGGTDSAAARRLERALGAIASGDAEAIGAFQSAVVRTLPGTLAALRMSLDADSFDIADLPGNVISREMAKDGRAKIEVTPSEDVRDPAAMNQFVDAVRAVAPNAVGSPVIIVEAGQTVVRAFRDAGVLSFALISLLLIVLLRNLRDVAMVFAPIVLAGILTVAVTVVFGPPFNFANVIVLPLLFGLGVASGIHLIHREKSEKGTAAAMATSTPRAVLYSALTTIGSFGSIALSSHPGTSSMGFLLTVAILLTLLATLVVLPALMAVFPSRSRNSAF